MLDKSIISILSFLLITSFPFLSSAEDKVVSNIKISEFAIAKTVEQLTPKEISESFSSSVSRLYAFCKVTGAQEVINIMHNWYYENKLMAEVRLSVKSKNWRTFSSKKILPEWTGQWRVDITTEDGLVLSTLKFTIK